MKISILILLLLVAFGAEGQIITTYAGNGTIGYTGDGGQATSAGIFGPGGIKIDKTGNLYIADAGHYVIRKVSPAGIISTIAGTGSTGYSGDGGPATAALLGLPVSVTCDSIGNVYIVDADGVAIRKINTSGIISTIAGTGVVGYSGDGGPSTAAKINYPTDIVADNIGNVFFVDEYNNRIRKISTSGIISTIAGTGVSGFSGDGGPATAAKIGVIYAIARDKLGSIYISDDSAMRIRKISPSGITTTICGNGTQTSTGDGGAATAATIGTVLGLAIDNNGNLLLSDEEFGRIRLINQTTGIITTIIGDGTPCGFAGDGGQATAAQMCAPYGITVDKYGSIYFSDAHNHRIRSVRNTLGVTHPDEIQTSITLSPNPTTSGLFSLNINTTAPETATITITNVTGSTIKTLQTETNKAVDIQLNVPTGLYFVTVTTAHGVWTEKVVVE